MCARTHFEIFDKNLILHSKFQKKSMLMTQYRLLSHRKWLSIRYWGMLRNALLWGPWSLKFRHLLNRWPWPNIVGCHYCCGPTKPPILDLFAITQYSILSHNKLLSIEYWVLKDTESLYFTISTLCNGYPDGTLEILIDHFGLINQWWLVCVWCASPWLMQHQNNLLKRVSITLEVHLLKQLKIDCIVYIQLYTTLNLKYTL